MRSTISFQADPQARSVDRSQFGVQVLSARSSRLEDVGSEQKNDLNLASRAPAHASMGSPTTPLAQPLCCSRLSWRAGTDRICKLLPSALQPQTLIAYLHDLMKDSVEIVAEPRTRRLHLANARIAPRSRSIEGGLALQLRGLVEAVIPRKRQP